MNTSVRVAAGKGRLGRLEKIFLALLLLDLALYFFPAAAGIGALLTLTVLVLGSIVLVRLVRRNLKKLLWRLRNRLIVSYLFIAVVPICLLMLLVAIGGYVVMGQIAVYAVNAELERRSTSHSSHSGFERSRRWENTRAAIASSALSSPGSGSAVCRTW